MYTSEKDKSKPKSLPIRKYVSTIAILVLGSGLYLKYNSFYDVVPITNRKRIMWQSVEEDEEVGYPEQRWMLSQVGKPRLPHDHTVTTVVREIFDRLLEANQLKDINLEMHVFDDFGQYSQHTLHYLYSRS
jgi:hypothetical protein